MIDPRPHPQFKRETPDPSRHWRVVGLLLYMISFVLPVGDMRFFGGLAFLTAFLAGIIGFQLYALVLWLANPLLWSAVALWSKRRSGLALGAGGAATLAALMSLRLPDWTHPVTSENLARISGVIAWISGIGGYTAALAWGWWHQREGRPLRITLFGMMVVVAMVAVAAAVWRWAEPLRDLQIRCDRDVPLTGSPPLEPGRISDRMA